MPARQLAFTKKNILSAWETAGAIPFNPRRVQKSETQVDSKDVSHHRPPNSIPTVNRVPKTPRAVSRHTWRAIALVSRNTPSSKKLKELLAGLSEGFQQAIADKALEEESHKQYRELVGKSQRVKTSDRRKLTAATVVTTETVLHLRENRERLDAEKAAKQARKLTKALDSLSLTSQPSKPIPKSKKKVPLTSEDIIPTIRSGEESTDWEDGGDSDGSVYKGPSRALHGTHSTNTRGIQEDNTGEAVGIDGRNVQQKIRRSSRRLRSSD